MADPRDISELLEELREAGQDTIANEIEEREDRYKGSSLRKQNAELAARAEAAEAKAARLEMAPKRQQAFHDYGVDLQGLRPAEREALEAYEGELDPEKIGEFVERYQLPLAEAQEQQAEAPPPAAGIVSAARSAPARSAGALRITPDDVRTWSATQVLEWSSAHPAEWSEVLQGKIITGIPAPQGTGAPRETADVRVQGAVRT